MQCQEEYMTAASMREKEMEALKFKMKTADKKLKIEVIEIFIYSECIWSNQQNIRSKIKQSCLLGFW